MAELRRVGSGRFVGLADEFVEPGVQGLWYLGRAVLGVEPAQYAGGCLERGWAGVEVLLDLGARGFLERALEKVVRVRAGVAADERGRGERR